MQEAEVRVNAGEVAMTPERADELMQAVRQAMSLGVLGRPTSARSVADELNRAASTLRDLADAARRLAFSIGRLDMPTADEIARHTVGEEGEV